MRYYDVMKNWRKVRRHVDHPDLQRVLVRDMDRYTRGALGKRFLPGMRPLDTDPGDWIYELRKKGRPPAFWQYVRLGACYWLVNFNLLLAQRVEPHRAWRIIESDRHASVWDGEETLFDMNWLAFGVPPGQVLRGRPRRGASTRTAEGDRPREPDAHQSMRR